MADAAPPELRVRGNRLAGPDGREVWLQGLSVDSTQWNPAGERTLETIPVAIEKWKANVIRLPLNDNFWFGRGKPPKMPSNNAEAYRQLVDAAIEKASSRGAYVALDLHSFGAPKERHAAFWKDVAERYKNNPAVFFELFNEPHSISWKIWRDGGDLNSPDNKNTDVNPAENKEKQEGAATVGMQALVDSVRATGARNIVIAGGLDWGYDLSGVVDGYALNDRDGNGIVYSSHIYPWKKDWQEKVLAAAEKYPLFIGEVGTPPDWKGWDFIPPEQRWEDLGKGEWAPDVLGLIQKHRLHWTGFSFHPNCGPQIISDWQFTPTPYWGKWVQRALDGERFEIKRMR